MIKFCDYYTTNLLSKPFLVKGFSWSYKTSEVLFYYTNQLLLFQEYIFSVLISKYIYYFTTILI